MPSTNGMRQGFAPKSPMPLRQLMIAQVRPHELDSQPSAVNVTLRRRP
jgi:hypothetical protein